MNCAVAHVQFQQHCSTLSDCTGLLGLDQFMKIGCALVAFYLICASWAHGALNPGTACRSAGLKPPSMAIEPHHLAVSLVLAVLPAPSMTAATGANVVKCLPK